MKIQVPPLYPLAAALLLVLFSLSGCATYADLSAGTVKEIGSPVVERETVSIPPPAPEAPPSKDYLVGPGDILLVNVAGRPEFIVPSSGSSGMLSVRSPLRSRS